jgi:hypothetical protein
VCVCVCVCVSVYSVNAPIRTSMAKEAIRVVIKAMPPDATEGANLNLVKLSQMLVWSVTSAHSRALQCLAITSTTEFSRLRPGVAIPTPHLRDGVETHSKTLSLTIICVAPWARRK